MNKAMTPGQVKKALKVLNAAVASVTRSKYAYHVTLDVTGLATDADEDQLVAWARNATKDLVANSHMIVRVQTTGMTDETYKRCKTWMDA
jgi:uncharacterized protein (UPF0333 family)